MSPISVNFLFTRLAERGTRSYGLSAVTQLEHALQSAALAAEQHLGNQMVVAALFHDVGHLVYDLDVHLAEDGIDDKHEELSANALEPLFGQSVSEPVRLHVASKRYLCTTETDYYAKLAEDSVISLQVQGGLMSDAELETFRQNPHYQMGVALRRIDDQAKIPSLQVPKLDSYRAVANAIQR